MQSAPVSGQAARQQQQLSAVAANTRGLQADSEAQLKCHLVALLSLDRLEWMQMRNRWEADWDKHISSSQQFLELQISHLFVNYLMDIYNIKKKKALLKKDAPLLGWDMNLFSNKKKT